MRLLGSQEGSPTGTGTATADLVVGDGVNIQAVTFEAEGLGDRSYLVHDGEVAAVIDPQREQERYVAAAKALGVSITHVFETHVHNDYVSGGLGLARQLGAVYVLPEGEDLAFADECLTLGDGGELTVGSLRVSALATPGHTPHHLAYLLSTPTGGRSYVCTGGSVLPGAVGRTDLLGDERADELAAAQWHSVRRLLSQLDAGTSVLPTHGFGSFCSAAPGAGGGPAELTVGLERQRNPAVRAALEDFVLELARDQPPVPAYYRYMAPINRRGPGAPRYEPTARLSAADLDRWLAAGSAVADLRPRRAFAAGHRRGALNIELGPNLTTYFGWVVPFEGPIRSSPARTTRSRSRVTYWPASGGSSSAGTPWPATWTSGMRTATGWPPSGISPHRSGVARNPWCLMSATVPNGGPGTWPSPAMPLFPNWARKGPPCPRTDRSGCTVPAVSGPPSPPHSSRRGG